MRRERRVEQHEPRAAVLGELLRDREPDAAEPVRDQVDAAFLEARVQRLFERDGLGAQDEPIASAQGDDLVAGRREELGLERLEHVRGDGARDRRRPCRGAGRPCRALGERDVDRARRDAGQLLGDHERGPERGGLLRVDARRLVPHALHARRHRDDVNRPGQRLLRERLRDEERAREAELEVAVEEARARPERLAIGDEPRVHDARGRVCARPHLAQQALVALGALLGEELIVVVAELVEGVALAHGDDAVALAAQPLRERRYEAGAVGEGEPGAALRVGREVGRLLPPDGAGEPARHVHHARRRRASAAATTAGDAEARAGPPPHPRPARSRPRRRRSRRSARSWAPRRASRAEDRRRTSSGSCRRAARRPATVRRARRSRRERRPP